MIQQYKININPNFTGDCGGPIEPVEGTVEVCPGNPVIKIECDTELDQCVDNYVEVTIQEQCSCQEGLPFCGGTNNTFETTVDLTCGCSQFTCTDYISQYTYCPSAQWFDDGCGSFIDCGTACDGPPTGQDICIEGNCVCQPYCGENLEVPYTCGDDGCEGYCGTCADGDPCTYCPENGNYCTPYLPEMFWNTQPIAAFELGDQPAGGENSFNISFNYRGISLEDQPFQIYFANQDSGISTYFDNISMGTYSCNTFSTKDYTFSLNDINTFFEDNSLSLGNYKILIKTTNNSGTNPSLLSSNIQIIDDFILGCTDICAVNYNSEATIENNECEYIDICTDILANNWLCLTEECEGGAYCSGGTQGTDYALAVDAGECTFDPVAFINDITDTLYEGNQITIVGNDSLPMTSDSDYDVSPTITEYSWSVYDTEGRTWNSIGSQIGFTIPLYVDPTQEYGGGGKITSELTVTNSQGFTNTYSRDFLIGDIDILATQLSEFSSIYIPGELETTLIGCYLPPKDEGDYDLLETLEASFYNVTSNPDDTEDENLVSGLFFTGDSIFVKLCIGNPCEGDNLLQTALSYNTTLGRWLGGSTDVPLVPGMGIQIKLNNGGWFQWTIPSEE